MDCTCPAETVWQVGNVPAVSLWLRAWDSLWCWFTLTDTERWQLCLYSPSLDNKCRKDTSIFKKTNNTNPQKSSPEGGQVLCIIYRLTEYIRTDKNIGLAEKKETNTVKSLEPPWVFWLLSSDQAISYIYFWSIINSLFLLQNGFQTLLFQSFKRLVNCLHF